MRQKVKRNPLPSQNVQAKGYEQNASTKCASSLWAAHVRQLRHVRVALSGKGPGSWRLED